MIPAMQTLINRARQNGWWLLNTTYNLWASPDEAEAQIAIGIDWRIDNTILRDPVDRETTLIRNVELAQMELDLFRAKLRLSKEAAYMVAAE